MNVEKLRWIVSHVTNWRVNLDYNLCESRVDFGFTSFKKLIFEKRYFRPTFEKSSQIQIRANLTDGSQFAEKNDIS